jgi:hypothetical protein
MAQNDDIGRMLTDMVSGDVDREYRSREEFTRLWRHRGRIDITQEHLQIIAQSSDMYSAEQAAKLAGYAYLGDPVQAQTATERPRRLEALARMLTQVRGPQAEVIVRALEGAGSGDVEQCFRAKPSSYSD